MVGRAVDGANELGDDTPLLNVGTVGVVTVGDGVMLLGDGLIIVGDVLNVDGDVFNVDGVVPDADGVVPDVDGDVPRVVGVALVPIDPVVPVTPLRPADDSVVLVGDVGVADDPIELVVADVDGTADVKVVGGLGDVRIGDAAGLDVPALGLDIVPGPAIHGYGAVIGAD
jgi:hypothetical protein